MMAEWSMFALALHLPWCIVENIKIIYGLRPLDAGGPRLLGRGRGGNETGWKSKGSGRGCQQPDWIISPRLQRRTCAAPQAPKIKAIHPSVWMQLAFHKYNWFIKQQLIKRLWAPSIHLKPVGPDGSVTVLPAEQEDWPLTQLTQTGFRISKNSLLNSLHCWEDWNTKIPFSGSRNPIRFY